MADTAVSRRLPQASSHELRHLRPTLTSVQIFFIGLTVVIGTGVFNDYGKVAKTAGPTGLIIAFTVVAFISICAMNGLSEMIQLFPTVNPIVEFVHHFVDHELATVVGISYWFAYAVFFPLQLCTAASYIDLYTGTSTGWKACKLVFFYGIVPLVLILINIGNVKFFGHVETISGALKFTVLIAVIGMILYVAGESPAGKNIGQGVTSRLSPDGWSGSAIGLSINFIVFSFIGVESPAVATFEARDILSIRWASRFLTPVVVTIYLVCAIAQSMSIDWRNDIHIGTLLVPSMNPFSLPDDPTKSSTSPPIVAALNGGKPQMARAMNGMLIFCALSAANSSLYVASRMIYGLAFVNNRENQSHWRFLARLNEHHAPRNAVVVSSVFIVLAWVHVAATVQTDRAISWFSNAGSFCVVFAWAAISLAYTRYHWWFRKFRGTLLAGDEYRKYNRKSKEKLCSTPLSWPQPVLAYLALFGCIGIVFGLASSAMWTQTVTTRDFFQFYTMSVLLPLGWITLKIYACIETSWRELEFYVKLGDTPEQFERTVTFLTQFLKPLRMKTDRSPSIGEESEMEIRNGTSTALFQPKPPSRVNTASRRV